MAVLPDQRPRAILWSSCMVRLCTCSKGAPSLNSPRRFKVHHPERVESAIDRYMNEVRRILGVLNVALEGKEWLVGDKMTFADMAFVPYHSILHLFFECQPEDTFKDYPNVGAWHRR